MAADRPFEAVRRWVSKIPSGRVMTYGQLSELVERRLTPVGVGWAIRAAGEDIPWHRVLNARGAVSTDKAHPGLQRAMLEAEGVHFDAAGCCDLRLYTYRPRTAADGGTAKKRKRSR